jgi:hypothetical protein
MNVCIIHQLLQTLHSVLISTRIKVFARVKVRQVTYVEGHNVVSKEFFEGPLFYSIAAGVLPV